MYCRLRSQNFDYKRWAKSFTVPPLQSLDEVLMLALGGAELVLKARRVLLARSELTLELRHGGV